MTRKGVRWFARCAIALLWTISTPWCANLWSQWWEPPLKLRSQIPAVSDAAIVLGGLTAPAPEGVEHKEFNRSAERLTEAVTLWREGRVRFILITSGSGDLLHPNASEAPSLVAWARSQGVPDAALLVEDRSRNTRENASFSLPLVQDKGLKTFVLITSAFHMPRSEAIFRKAGFDREGRSFVTWPVDSQRDDTAFPFSAVPEPSALTTNQALLKEWAGFVVYAASGYL